MLKRLFYILKPIVPRKIQLYLRKYLILTKLPAYRDAWPILKGSEKKPEGFTGWPDNKKFAFVLTHDVEHKKGYKRVLSIMEIEKQFGFVSSYNFVPERDYVVERELLNTLKNNGFEYGVHGLNHDGKLFSSEEVFLKRASRINQYLKEWDAVGFRAPAMHHNLDWIGELDIQYDLSTFDTDPFEPQPDGMGTIFPFVVNGDNDDKSYVEMPYTLVQDFTLFILMKEKDIRIWQEKIDWIADNGGMVLVNVHPDYICFGNNEGIEEFSIRFYTDLLSYVKKNYYNQYWNALPRDVSNYILNISQLNIN